MIDLYTAPTPNGHKATVTLEEMGLAYNLHALDFQKQEQKAPEFLKINPNGRIPAIVDDGFAVFESGAIMIYLAEKTGMLMPSDVQGRSRVIQWLMFQMGGIGPMMGQANVFFRYFPEKFNLRSTVIRGESARLFGVLDGHLAQNEYLAGDYSIADIANWCWVRIHEWPGIDITPFPHLQRWMAAIADRPAAQRGINIPPRVLPTNEEDTKKFVEQARKMLVTGKDD